MYNILSKQKERVIKGLYNKESFIFLVEQAYSNKKITKEQRDELITFEEK